MSPFFVLLAAALCGPMAFAQIDGTVINASTGMPQAGVEVSLIHPGENGMETLATATSGADGSFKIDKELPPPPALLRATYGKVDYNQIVPPGTPSTGLKLNVYESTNQFGTSIAQQQLLVVDVPADAVQVSETFLLQNSGKTTFNDPVNGSVQFYLPKSAAPDAKVQINAPNGMPITRSPEKTSRANVYKESYPIKPGETQYDVSYKLPSVSKFSEMKLGSGPTILVAAESVQLSGPDLKDMGVKQISQGGPRAHVYEVTAKAGASYEVDVLGQGVLQSPTQQAQADEGEDNGSPKPHADVPRVYERLPWVLGLTLGVLALGGALLFRRSAT